MVRKYNEPVIHETKLHEGAFSRTFDIPLQASNEMMLRRFILRMNLNWP